MTLSQAQRDGRASNKLLAREVLANASARAARSQACRPCAKWDRVLKGTNGVVEAVTGVKMHVQGVPLKRKLGPASVEASGGLHPVGFKGPEYLCARAPDVSRTFPRP